MSRINDMNKDGEVYVKFDDSSAWQKMGTLIKPELIEPTRTILSRMWTTQHHEGTELMTALGRVPESSGLSGKQFTVYVDTGLVLSTGAALPGVVQLSGLTMKSLTPGIEIGSAYLAGAVMTTTDRQVLAGLDIRRFGVLNMFVPKEARLAEELWLSLSEPTRVFLVVALGIEGRVELCYPELLVFGVRLEQAVRWCADRWPGLFL